MYVLKFGGSSVSNGPRIGNIAQLIKPRVQSRQELAIVVSALGGITDKLIRTATEASLGKEKYLRSFGEIKSIHFDVIQELGFKESDKLFGLLEENFDTLADLLKGVYLVREASLRTMDYILSFGERNSALIISEYFNTYGIVSHFCDAREIIKTNKNFGNAKVSFEKTYPLVKEYFTEKMGSLAIVTGFIASDIGGLTTTLGRGGSDYTAAIIAGALDAEALEIWTDVDGVLTSNPRIVKNAYTIPRLSYDEAMEMSHFGAKVIYPPTIQPALSKNIPIYIKNTFNPTFAGTLISKDIVTEGRRKITGVSSISEVSLITLEGSGLVGIPGTAARLFNILGKNEINVIMITQASSEHSICFAVIEKDSDIAVDSLSDEFKKEIESKLIKPIKCENQLSLIAVIGEKMRSVPGVAGSLFKSLGNNGINVIAIAQGSSELNITIAINQKDEHKALNLVHDAFFLSQNRRLNLFLVGVGLIGGTLLKQIKKQQKALIKEKNLDIRVIGVANSRKMIFESEGLELNDWSASLNNEGAKSELSKFIDKMVGFNMANSIFIDCTATHLLKDFYPQILENNISISTANKVAASDKYENYKRLQEIALKNNVQFLYETNVGAGLPVISTLDGLVKSGDEVESIKAVISGSLSFIFNNYSPKKSFKELILAAREKGYTEPDPRDDLSGQDIKRKIIILSRVAGYPIESEDVDVQAILPQACMDAKGIDEFFVELENHDSHFREMIEKAHREEAKLRYIASLVNGKASITLEMVKSDSPFYNLGSTDNMIVLHTKRYKERPLVIQGPGAGADVTAAGVFAEIIQLGSAIA